MLGSIENLVDVCDAEQSVDCDLGDVLYPKH